MPDIEMDLGASDCFNLLFKSKFTSIFEFEQGMLTIYGKAVNTSFSFFTRSVNHLIFLFLSLFLWRSLRLTVVIHIILHEVPNSITKNEKR